MHVQATTRVTSSPAIDISIPSSDHEELYQTHLRNFVLSIHPERLTEKQFMAAAYKKRRSLPRDFISLIFTNDRTQMILSDCILVYEELERDPGPISRIMSDDELMVQLLTDFDSYASRIARFFSLSQKYSVSRTRRNSRAGSGGLADELVENLLLPLLGEDFWQFHLGQPFLDVFGCIIDFCLPYNPRALERLARNIVGHTTLFGALVSGRTTGGIMKQWMGFFTVPRFDIQVISEWTGALVRLCISCEGNHDIGKFGHIAATSQGALDKAMWRLEKEESIRVLRAVGESFPCRMCYEASTGSASAQRNDRDQKDTWDRLGFSTFTELLGERIGLWRVLISSQALDDMQQVHAEGM